MAAMKSAINKEKDKTDEFLSLFSNLKEIQSENLPEIVTTSFEENTFHFLHFYERQKQNIDIKHIRRIIFSELPELCFQKHVENAVLIVEILRSINELRPTSTPNIVLFLTMLCLTNKTLPMKIILERNEMNKASFTALTFFLHHAYKQRLTLQNRKLMDVITFTNPILFSKLLLFSNSKNLISLLQFGLRLETFKKLCFPIHPLFLSAAELLCWFFESERYWNVENPQRRTQHTYFIDKLALFCRNFKVLLLSTYNPHEIENKVSYILMKYSKISDFKEVEPYLAYFFPESDFQTCKPPNLQHMCRYVIRSRLDEKWNLPYGVWKLSLPRELASYLNFNIDEKGNETV